MYSLHQLFIDKVQLLDSMKQQCIKLVFGQNEKSLPSYNIDFVRHLQFDCLDFIKGFEL